MEDATRRVKVQSIGAGAGVVRREVTRFQAPPPPEEDEDEAPAPATAETTEPQMVRFDSADSGSGMVVREVTRFNRTPAGDDEDEEAGEAPVQRRVKVQPIGSGGGGVVRREVTRFQPATAPAAAPAEGEGDEEAPAEGPRPRRVKVQPIGSSGSVVKREATRFQPAAGRVGEEEEEVPAEGTEGSRKRRVQIQPVASSGSGGGGGGGSVVQRVVTRFQPAAADEAEAEEEQRLVSFEQSVGEGHGLVKRHPTMLPKKRPGAEQEEEEEDELEDSMDGARVSFEYSVGEGRGLVKRHPTMLPKKRPGVEQEEEEEEQEDSVDGARLVSFEHSVGEGHGLVKRHPTMLPKKRPGAEQEEEEDEDGMRVSFEHSVGEGHGLVKRHPTMLPKKRPGVDQEEEEEQEDSVDGARLVSFEHSVGEGHGLVKRHPTMLPKKRPGAEQEEEEEEDGARVSFEHSVGEGHGLVKRHPTMLPKKRPGAEQEEEEEEEQEDSVDGARLVSFEHSVGEGHGLVKRHPTMLPKKRPGAEQEEEEDDGARVSFEHSVGEGHGLVKRHPTMLPKKRPGEEQEEEEEDSTDGSRLVSFEYSVGEGRGLVKRHPTMLPKKKPGEEQEEDEEEDEDSAERHVVFGEVGEGHGVVMRKATGLPRKPKPVAPVAPVAEAEAQRSPQQGSPRRVCFGEGHGAPAREPPKQPRARTSPTVAHPPKELQVRFGEAVQGRGVVQRQLTPMPASIRVGDDPPGPPFEAEEAEPPEADQPLLPLTPLTPETLAKSQEAFRPRPIAKPVRPRVDDTLHSPTSNASTSPRMRKKVSFSRLDVVRGNEAPTAPAQETLSKATHGHIQLMPLMLRMDKEAIQLDYKLQAHLKGSREHTPPWMISAGHFADRPRLSLMVTLDEKGDCNDTLLLELISRDPGKPGVAALAELCLVQLGTGVQAVNLRLFHDEETVGELAMECCAINFGRNLSTPPADVLGNNPDVIRCVSNDTDQSSGSRRASSESAGPVAGQHDWTTAVEVQILKLVGLPAPPPGRAVPGPKVEVSLVRPPPKGATGEAPPSALYWQQTLDPDFGDMCTLYLKEVAGLELRLDAVEGTSGQRLGRAKLRVEDLHSGATEPVLHLRRGGQSETVGEMHPLFIVTKREPGANFLDQFMPFVLLNRKFSVDQLSTSSCFTGKGDSFIQAPKLDPKQDSPPTPPPPLEPVRTAPQRMRSPQPPHPLARVHHPGGARMTSPIRPVDPSQWPASPALQRPSAETFDRSSSAAFAAAAEDVARIVTTSLEQGVLGRVQASVLELQARLPDPQRPDPTPPPDPRVAILRDALRDAMEALVRARASQLRLAATAMHCQQAVEGGEAPAGPALAGILQAVLRGEAEVGYDAALSRAADALRAAGDAPGLQ
eukprot:EG_transcript_538